MIILGSLVLFFGILNYFESDVKTEGKPILKDRDAFNKSFRE